MSSTALTSTTARAHPNIALIKYWGKAPGPGNVPATPSLSITLDTLSSTTSVSEASRDQIVLNGKDVRDEKIQACLDRLRREFAIPPVSIVSDNNFPTAAGLASSASGFAALVTAINAHFDLGLNAQQRSEVARQASGSAARSIFGGFVGLQGPHWTAESVLDAAAWPLSVVIAVTDTSQKSVLSSSGMARSAATSAFYPAWVTTTPEDYREARKIIRARDFPALATLAESSCLKMHAVMMSSSPPMLYWRPATVACMQAIGDLRDNGTAVFFTVDAGPQIKAVCLPEAAATVASRLGEISGVVSTTVVGLGEGARVLTS
jgi:diphosphomevalonate decarboxylase